MLHIRVVDATDYGCMRIVQLISSGISESLEDYVDDGEELAIPEDRDGRWRQTCRWITQINKPDIQNAHWQ